MNESRAETILNSVINTLENTGETIELPKPMSRVEEQLQRIDEDLKNNPGGGGGSITVDTELSETSANPVQNAVITQKINNFVKTEDVKIFDYNSANFYGLYDESGVLKDSTKIKTIAFETRGCKNIKIKTIGGHNRFIVTACDELVAGTPADRIGRITVDESSTETEYNFSYDGNRKYILVILAYGAETPTDVIITAPGKVSVNDVDVLSRTDIDTELNESSTNPVANNVVVKAMEDLSEEIKIIAKDIVISSPQKLHEIIKAGLAKKYLDVGDQIVIPHSDYGDVVWDIIGFDHDIDVNGAKHSITIQTHNTIDGAMMYDVPEREVATETTFSAELFYYILDGSYKLLVAGTDYTVGDAIPTDKTYYHNAIKDTSGRIIGNGYVNWEESNIRQYLNADGTDWWTPQHVGDAKPPYATNSGFLSGFDDDFKAILGATKKKTALNTVSDGGGFVETEDKVFLLSRSEVMGGYSESNVVEGEPYMYYRKLVPSVTSSATDGRVKLNADNTARQWRLRSAYTSATYSIRVVTETGAVANFGAANSSYIAPACILV